MRESICTYNIWFIYIGSTQVVVMFTFLWYFRVQVKGSLIIPEFVKMTQASIPPSVVKDFPTELFIKSISIRKLPKLCPPHRLIIKEKRKGNNLHVMQQNLFHIWQKFRTLLFILRISFLLLSFCYCTFTLQF